MNRRNFAQVLVASALCSLFAPGVVAQVAGKGYAELKPAQPGGGSGRIEVIEFFSYACPHCMELEPLLGKWRAALPKDVVFRRVPVGFGRPEWAGMARLYVTLNTMGLADKLDMAVFEAIHKRHVNLMDERIRADWLARQGVDAKKYNDTFRSFGVDSMVKRTEQLTQD